MSKELEALENHLILSIVAKDKDNRCAILDLVYNNTHHIIYETFDEEQIIALDKVFHEQENVLNTIFQNLKLDENYSEQCSGSTKAYKLIIPNCIVVGFDGDESYTDYCFPNMDFAVIDDFVNRRT